MRIAGTAVIGAFVAFVACAVFPASAPTKSFIERFAWKGDHAAHVGQGKGTTVWWNRDTWDVRGDTFSIAVNPGGVYPDGADFPWKGYHVDIHKAASRSLHSGEQNNTDARVGGDGSAGLGIMHLDFQGILSARLRNPMLIGGRKPASVSFYSRKFATTGHWWEVAITPADTVTAGEFTAVPARQEPDSLNNPLNGSAGDGSTNGPGHRCCVEDSINVISTGFPDVPDCEDVPKDQREGWHARFAVTRGSHIGDRRSVRDFVNPRRSEARLIKVDPADRQELYPWRIEFARNRITLFGALKERSRRMRKIDAWNVKIPWSQVYVNLLYVAYQADHHPQVHCGFEKTGGQVQELAWRDVRVRPVKYGRTQAFPRDADNDRNTLRSAGWLSYDTRDIQRNGDPVGGQQQANPAGYDQYTSYAYCSQLNEGGILCGDPDRQRTTVVLKTTLGPSDLGAVSRAQLLADVRYPGSVSVEVNGKDVGRLQAVPATLAASPAGDPFDVEAWWRRSIDVPDFFLHTGENTFTLRLDPNQQVELDRLELELDH